MEMKEEFNKILQDVRSTDNPSIKALYLSVYLSDALKESKINIYEAYLLHGEIINYIREGYILPAWNGKAGISECIAILNQRLLALVFKDDEYANVLKEFGHEALKLCIAKRAHYILDNYEEYLNIDDKSTDWLQKLYNVRKKHNSLSYEKGPYHIEEFPFHYYEPEKMLLDKIDLQNMKSISDDIETLLIELNSQ